VDRKCCRTLSRANEENSQLGPLHNRCLDALGGDGAANPPAEGRPEPVGFGFGWWVWDAKFYPGNVWASPFQGTYEARGTGGQFITVIPARGLVLVHKTDIDAHPAANLVDWPTITSMVLASACPNGQCTTSPERGK